MENKEIVAEVENNVENVEAEPIPAKPTIRERIASAPAKIGAGIKKHWKGIVAGTATVAAVGTAAILAGKAAAEGAIDAPFEMDGAIDAAKDAVGEVVEG